MLWEGTTCDDFLCCQAQNLSVLGQNLETFGITSCPVMDSDVGTTEVEEKLLGLMPTPVLHTLFVSETGKLSCLDIVFSTLPYFSIFLTQEGRLRRKVT